MLYLLGLAALLCIALLALVLQGAYQKAQKRKRIDRVKQGALRRMEGNGCKLRH